MELFMNFLDLIVFVGLIALGFFFGRAAEKKHYKSIRKREQELRKVLVLTEKTLPKQLENCDGKLVTGCVVISVDYFKTLVAGLKTIFGGRLTSYESLIDRARREALLRMQQKASDAGAIAVMNMKFETSRISGNAAQGIGSIEVLAYGTALMPAGVASSQ
jgi:uncharacterized protein YbjQ (UPF0145 family)